MRNRGSIVSVVTSSAGLQLTFHCPVCGHRGDVTVGATASLPSSAYEHGWTSQPWHPATFRCPGCRQAFQVTRGWELLWNADTPPKERVTRRRRIQPMRKTDDPPNWVGGFLVASAAIVLPLVAVFWWLSSGTGPAASTDDLPEAARAFTEAWLAGDHDRAVAWIDEKDRSGFRAWWRSTRAVLTTGAGTDFRWGIVSVELDHEQESRAVLRVRFYAGRSDQQRLQTWKKTATGWKLDLSRESSPPDSDAN